MLFLIHIIDISMILKNSFRLLILNYYSNEYIMKGEESEIQPNSMLKQEFQT